MGLGDPIGLYTKIEKLRRKAAKYKKAQPPPAKILRASGGF